MNWWLLVSRDRGPTKNDNTPKIDEWHIAQMAIAPNSIKESDGALLWRSGNEGGLVAIGAVSEISEVAHPYYRDEDSVVAGVRLTEVFFSDPIPPETLGSLGLSFIAARARESVRNTGRTNRYAGHLSEISVSNEQIKLIRSEGGQRRQSDSPVGWMIRPGTVVDRTQLHGLYGGNTQTSCSASARTPNVFLFLGRNRNLDQITPQRDGDSIIAPGHPQWRTDLSRENMSLLSHAMRGKPLRVFEQAGSECCYIGEFIVDLKDSVANWIRTGERKRARFPGLRDFIEEEQYVPLIRMNALEAIDYHPGMDLFSEASRVDLSFRVVADEQPSGSAESADSASVDRNVDISSAMHKLIELIERSPGAAEEMGDLNDAQFLASIVARACRQADLSKLREAVEDPSMKEPDLQKILEQMTWIFGGEFLPETARRNLTLGDELDFSLVRPDGSLHGVEIKRAKVSNLIKRHRGQLIVGGEVNDAVGQAMNYLRGLDEQYHRIALELGVNCRRASMTVLIGYTSFVDSKVSPNEIDETLRTYNSHLSRVHVMTYDQLLDSALRSLDLVAPIRTTSG